MPDPLSLFQKWFNDAKRHPRIGQPDAMCLSTVSAKGSPSARMVLLKDVDKKGFTFFTNIESPKGQHLRETPQAALTFFWEPLHRQVRVEGKVVRVPKTAADYYFASRPRLSQIGSWASRQSQLLKNRQDLLNRFTLFTRHFKGKNVPAPLYWQGFCLIPSRMEFWQERPNRLHERWIYVRKTAGGWTRNQLYP